MRALSLLVVLSGSWVALAAPSRGLSTSSHALSERQARNAPPPCERADPEPTEEETKERFDKFANAFIVTKNITEAFEYIAEDYINHNPLATNGAASAWGILSPIWPGLSITVLGTTFKGDQGWLHYQVSSLGEVVDRFRWEGGCIAEHWDQGEKYPSD